MDSRSRELSHVTPWSWDVERNIIWCLPEMFQLNGLERPIWAADAHKAIPVRRERWLAAMPPERRERLREFFDGVAATGVGGSLQFQVTSGNAIRWLSAYAVGETVDGRVRRVVGYTQDITADKLAEQRQQQIQQNAELQRHALERIAAGDPLEETLDMLCRQVERMFPGTFCLVLLHDPDAAVLRYGVAPSLSRDYCAAVDGMPVRIGHGACGSAAASGRVVAIEDVRADPRTESALEVLDSYGLRSVWAYPLRGVGGRILGTISLYRSECFAPPESEIRAVGSIGNLAALAIARDRISGAIQAGTSVYPTTGLVNRPRFLELLEQRLADPLRRTAVLFVEVDRFKYLGDDLGHIAAASLLAEVARRLRSAAGGDGVVGRFSGDEFTIAVDCAAGADLGDLVTRLQVAFSAPITAGDYELFLIATIGVARGEPASYAYGLVRDAAAAMHAARADGRGGHRIYSHALRTQAVDLIGRESELRRAIDFGELILHYQPILDVVNHRWDRVEALVRWNHPTRGLLAPGDFIPLAEKSGLIVPLGQRVIEIAARQAATWVRAVPGLRIALNVSVLQLSDERFADDTLALLERLGLSPDAVNLEVAESSLMQRLTTVAPVLERLRGHGMRIVVDDFGSGYSSLPHLGELPVDSLKIGRMFVGRITSDPVARIVVRSIVDIAYAHGLGIVAEGIEDAATLEAAEELGCRYAQGFHVGAPGPPEDVVALLFEAAAAAPLRVVTDSSD